MPRPTSSLRALWALPLAALIIGPFQGCGGEPNQSVAPPPSGDFQKLNPGGQKKPQKGMDRVGSESSP